MLLNYNGVTLSPGLNSIEVNHNKGSASKLTFENLLSWQLQQIAP